MVIYLVFGHARMMESGTACARRGTPLADRPLPTPPRSPPSSFLPVPATFAFTPRDVPPLLGPPCACSALTTAATNRLRSSTELSCWAVDMRASSHASDHTLPLGGCAIFGHHVARSVIACGESSSGAIPNSVASSTTSPTCCWYDSAFASAGHFLLRCSRSATVAVR